MTIFWAFAGPFNGAYGFRPGGGHGSPALARTLGGRPWRERWASGCGSVGSFSPVRCLGKSTPLAPGHGPSGSGATPQLGPDRFARTQSGGHAPAVGERLDEDQSPTGLGVRGEALETRQTITVSVGHLDAQGVRDDVQVEAEVPAGNTAVDGRVRRQFRDDLTCRVQRACPRSAVAQRRADGRGGPRGAWETAAR